MKITLSDILSGVGLTKINDNFQKIEDELNNKVMYRDNPLGEPNSVSTSIDMNGKGLYNLGVPTNLNDAARLADVRGAISGATAANLISYAPNANISSTTVQGAIDNLGTFKTAISSAVGAALVNYALPGTGAGLQSAAQYFQRIIDVTGFYANGVSGALVDPTGVIDSTKGIQAAVNYAQSLVTSPVDSVGDPVGGCDVLLRGSYKITEPIRISKSNVCLVGQGGATLYPYFTSLVGYNIVKPAIIVGNAEAWQTSGVITSATKYNRIEGVNIKTVAGYNSYVGVLLSGTRNAIVRDCLFERGYCGVFAENTSELLCSQVAGIGCTYSFIQDGRVNRIASSSILNVACTDNDVSSNLYNMITAYYPAHTGFLSINAGTTTINGMTCGNFSENPAPFPGLGLPPDSAGVHVMGGNLKWTRGMMLNGICFEASPTKNIDCIRIESLFSNNPVSGVSINSCHVQTHASDYVGGNVTTLLHTIQSGGGEISNVVVRDSGFTPQTVGYYTGRMVKNEGYGVVAFDGCYPNSAYASSSLGYYGSIRHSAYLEKVPTNALTPPGWVYTGTTTGCSSQGGSAGVPSFLRLTGSTGSITMAKSFSYRENMTEVGQVFITMLVRGNLDPVITAKVNGVGATLSSIVDAGNIARYGTAIIAQQGSGSTTLWKRMVFCFNPFDANYQFDTVEFTVGKPSSSFNADLVDLMDIRIGYFIGGQVRYNPF